MSSNEGVVELKNAPNQKHPAGLYVLFGAEMWERFSYYGMRALLVLYLVNHMGVERESALDVYATYTGLVYLTPLLGGVMADRFLGQRKAVLIGGILMALGHFAMAFESLLNLALGLLILGNGFFKPNISTMVGQLYPQNDTRKDSAYTIFYMGINLGGFVAPIACGALGESERFGWHYGFGLAGVGMVLGLLNFALFQEKLGHAGFAPGRSSSKSLRISAADWMHVVILAAIGAAGVYLALMPLPAINQRVPEILSRFVGNDSVAGVSGVLVRVLALAYFIALSLSFGWIIAASSRALGLGAVADKGPIEPAKVRDVPSEVEPGRGLASASETYLQRTR